ncbi:hypothetical protein EP18_04045 [Lysinibacillus sphaericus]|nr:hypothetical protein [Lysinibacillus sphaericus]KEK13040.1 hypothetical protein EP18_04045 [Lysinibacillus sphaericus]
MKRRQRKKNNIQKAQAYKDVLINKGFTKSNGYSVAPFRSLNGVDYGVYISNPKGIKTFIFPSLMEDKNYSLKAFDTTFNKRYFKEVSA